jgi:peptidoglycan-associated lipoprotein
MHKSVLLWSAVLGVALLSACSGPKTRPTAASGAGTTVPTDQSQTAGADNSSAYGAGTVGPAANAAGVAGPSGGQLQNRTLYFDFDSSEIRSDYDALIAAHARYLVANPSTRVRLEGNTDERGSREYNIGLGERRAQAVRRALMLQGVAESQLTTVSYGEERPAVTGHAEEAWSRNRRVEIVYLN